MSTPPQVMQRPFMQDMSTQPQQAHHFPLHPSVRPRLPSRPRTLAIKATPGGSSHVLNIVASHMSEAAIRETESQAAAVEMLIARAAKLHPVAQRSQKAGSETTVEVHQNCLLCCDDITTSQALRPCGQCPEGRVVCRPCLRRHVEIIIGQTPFGTTPRFTCPLCPAGSGEPQKLVTFNACKRVLPKQKLDECKKLGASCLAFFCSGCHQQRQLQVSIDGSKLAKLRKVTEQALRRPQESDGAKQSGNEPWQAQVLVVVEQLKAGAISPASAVLSMTEALTRARTNLHDTMTNEVLPAIADPIKRAAVHYSFLRRFPEFYTPCCRRKHCFNCHVAGGHQGLSCAQYQARKAQGEDVVTCPKCNVALVKGDGCSAVSCPCGHAFNFARRLEEMKVATASEFEAQLGLSPGANAWDEWTNLAAQAMTLASCDGPETDISRSASVWLHLNPDASRRLATAFERARSGQAALVPGIAPTSDPVPAIICTPIAPATQWRSGKMEEDGGHHFAYEIMDVISDGMRATPACAAEQAVSPRRLSADGMLRYVPHVLQSHGSSMLTAIRANAIQQQDRRADSAASAHGRMLQQQCAAQWAKKNERFLVDVRKWEDFFRGHIALSAEFASQSDQAPLIVEELMLSLGVSRLDTIRVHAALHDAQASRAFLERHTGPPSLMQAVRLRRAKETLERRTIVAVRRQYTSGPLSSLGHTFKLTNSLVGYGETTSASTLNATTALLHWVNERLARLEVLHSQAEQLEQMLNQSVLMIARTVREAYAMDRLQLECEIPRIDARDVLHNCENDIDLAILCANAQRARLADAWAEAQKHVPTRHTVMERINNLRMGDFVELRNLRRVPHQMFDWLAATHILLGSQMRKCEPQEMWQDIKRSFANPREYTQRLLSFDPTSAPSHLLQKVQSEYLQRVNSETPQTLLRYSIVASVLCEWVLWAIDSGLSPMTTAFAGKDRRDRLAMIRTEWHAQHKQLLDSSSNAVECSESVSEDND